MIINNNNQHWYTNATAAEQADFKNWLRTTLQSNVVSVNFVKSDGSLRTMKATLDTAQIVTEERKTERVKKPNPDVCSVWDIEAQAWRSFRYDRIQQIEIAV
jgi:uncharacterized protein YjaG (DUF416 family)